MIRKVRVSNFKSITDLTLDLGRVTVLIGANGSGKSNILEAIALASAATQNKLDNEFLISRGIRVTEARLMRSAFSHLTAEGSENGVPDAKPEESIQIVVEGDGGVSFRCLLFADETKSYPQWRHNFGTSLPPELNELLRKAATASKEIAEKHW